jgi:hypothetical protein
MMAYTFNWYELFIMPNKSYTACQKELSLIAQINTSINKQLFYNINELRQVCISINTTCV